MLIRNKKKRKKKKITVSRKTWPIFFPRASCILQATDPSKLSGAGKDLRKSKCRSRDKIIDTLHLNGHCVGVSVPRLLISHVDCISALRSPSFPGALLTRTNLEFKSTFLHWFLIWCDTEFYYTFRITDMHILSECFRCTLINRSVLNGLTLGLK